MLSVCSSMREKKTAKEQKKEKQGKESFPSYLTTSVLSVVYIYFC